MVLTCQAAGCGREFSKKNGLARHTQSAHAGQPQGSSSRWAAPAPTARPEATSHSRNDADMDHSETTESMFAGMLRLFEAEQRERDKEQARPDAAGCTHFICVVNRY